MEGEEKRKILVISLSNLSRDPRVYRQIELLRKYYEVHAAGKVASGIEDRFFELGQGRLQTSVSAWFCVRDRSYSLARRVVLILDRLFKLPCLKESMLLLNPNYNHFLSIASKISYDLVLANDLSSLSLAAKVRGKAKLLYDAHEYSAGQSSESKWLRIEKPYVEFLLKKYLVTVDAITTVCDSIAEKYASDFDITKPYVIMNAPAYRELSPKMREDGRIKIVHHGIASRPRAIEAMIRAVELLDDHYSLDLYLMAIDRQYYEELQAASKRSRRIRILEPVAMSELPTRLNEYDIGIYMLPPTSYNQLYALPNKIFEFVQARLTVAVGPSPEMAKIVEGFCLGVVAEDFSSEAMARAIGGLDYSMINSFKKNADRFAVELSSVPQMRRLEEIVRQLIES